jgi:aminocarboxymuconate-semialdehyde decarboxylase
MPARRPGQGKCPRSLTVGDPPAPPGGWLANTIGNPLDTTIALSHLIFEGTLDRFPRLKICSAHGGGYLPSYAARSDNSLRVAPDKDTGVKLKRKPTDYLRRLCYATRVFTSEALRHLARKSG